MSELVAAVRPRAGRLAFALSRDAIAVAGLALLGLVLTLVTWSTWGDLGRDTGYDLLAGSRVAHGDLPYVDFVYYYGPLAPMLLGFVGWIGGAGLGPAVALGLIVSLAVVLVTYALARTQVGPTGAFLAATVVAAVAFSPTNLSYVLPHTSSAPLAVLLTLCTLLGIARFLDGANARWLLVAGACAGLVALTRPEFELATLTAIALWLVLRARVGLSVRREAMLVVGPAVLVPALVYGAFLLAISPGRLLLDNLYPVDALRNGGNAIVRVQAPLTAHSFATLLGYLALYVVGALALVAAAGVAGRVSRRLAVGSTAVIIVGAAAVALARPEALRTGLQYAFGWLPAGAALAVAALLIHHGLRRRAWKSGRDQALVGLLVVLAVLAAKTYASFFFLATRAQPAVYAAPFAAIALARLHLVDLARGRRALVAGSLWLAFLAVATVGLTAKDARAERASVTGVGGTIKVPAGEADLYRGAIAQIESRTQVGEPILIAPQLTALYTLTERSNPLPQLSLLPGALPTVADQRQAIARLEQARVRLIVTDRHPFTEYGHGAFGKSFDVVLAAWIRRTFSHTATLRPRDVNSHTLDIWVRRRP